MFQILHDKVKVLDLADCEISDVGISAICKCPQLRKIDLNSNKQSRTNITSEGIQNKIAVCS
jgi:hypothetical protein